MLSVAAVGAVLACEGNPGGPGRSGGGPGQNGGAAPSTAAIVVGNIFFESNRNATVNPAVDTVAVGGTVTWTWTNTEDFEHSVRSQSAPGFPSSAIEAGDGTTYSVVFDASGTFEYDCAVHGTLMTGRLVVR